MHLSIVMPVLNEAAGIAQALRQLAPLRQRGAQLIVVDGGSRDATLAAATPHADLLLTSGRGRALQMNAGAAQAAGDALLFLHADTGLPPDADALLAAALQQADWGRFDVQLAGDRRMLAVIATMMNLRSRLTGIATGDQALFMQRSTFEQAGGFAPIPLMEDIELSRRLRRIGRPACLRARVTSSGRRWEQHGVWRTIFLMWRLRLAYFLGADPHALARAYGYRPPE